MGPRQRARSSAPLRIWRPTAASSSSSHRPMLATGTICCARSVRYEIVSWSDAVPTMDDGGDVPDRGNLCNLAEQAVARRSLENKIVFPQSREERKSIGAGKRVSVGVALGGRRALKKKKKQ